MGCPPPGPTSVAPPPRHTVDVEGPVPCHAASAAVLHRGTRPVRGRSCVLPTAWLTASNRLGNRSFRGGSPLKRIPARPSRAAHKSSGVPWTSAPAGDRVGCRLAASVRQVRRDQMELGPTGSDTERSWFLLSSGCDGSRYYRVAHGTGPIPNETQSPCRTLVACLVGCPLPTPGPVVVARASRTRACLSAFAEAGAERCHSRARIRAGCLGHPRGPGAPGGGAVAGPDARGMCLGPRPPCGRLVFLRLFFCRRGVRSPFGSYAPRVRCAGVHTCDGYDSDRMVWGGGGGGRS